MLTAVLFDLDNTLIDRDGAFRECVNARFQDAAARAELTGLDQRGHGDREALFAAWSRHAGVSITQAVLGPLIAARVQRDGNLLGALATLKRSVKLGIITNGGGENQRRKIHAAGIDEVIPREHVWISGEVGLEKPDPAIFLTAARALGVAPGNCLYIGDHAPHDLVGATAAEMRVRLVETPLNAINLSLLVEQERTR